MVPDESEFLKHVPLVIGMCMLGRIVNVIEERELDQLSTSWVMTWVPHLLCHHGTAAPEAGDEASSPMDEGTTMSVGKPEATPIPNPNH